MFVKFPYYHEGQLTILKSRLINNDYLLKRACKAGLQNYILSLPFLQSKFLAIGYRKKKVYLETQEDLSDKGIADVLEAVICAYFLDQERNKERGLRALWTNVLCRFSIIREAPFPDCRAISSLYDSNVVLTDVVRAHVTEIELQLGHSFRSPLLAIEAMTHPSFSNRLDDDMPTTACYQRLEFLGDALLDFVVTEYLYSISPPLDPGGITNWRSFFVCNSMLGYISVKSRFHAYMLYNSPILDKEIKLYMESIPDTIFGDIGAVLALPELANPPKALGDVVESLIGAVFIDSDGDMDEVTSVINQLVIKPYIQVVLEAQNKNSNSA